MSPCEVFRWILDSSISWNVCFIVANAILLGRRAYISYVEENMSASHRFALRANSLTYTSLWCFFAILTGVFVFFADEPGEGVNAVGVLFGEFVAICLWRPFFGNGHLIRLVVEETRERLTFFLVQGLGLNETECTRYRNANEKAIVELWTRHLKDKKWKDFTPAQRNDLMFDTGVECGKVLEDSTWEGVLYDVAAFFQEWRTEVENLRPILRVPEKIALSMTQGNDAGSQALLSVAILVANEDRDLRKSRVDWDERLASRQFSAARIAKRKAAAEGILRWPDCIAQEPRMQIQTISSSDVSDLKIIDGSGSKRCQGLECLPLSIWHTLTEIIQCGYLRRQPDNKIQANITFKYGNMVFNKDQWNPLRAIQRKPFRYITSATWMAGDVAFVVEQREVTGSSTGLDGSGYLSGALKLQFDVDEINESESWVQLSRPSTRENEAIWGDIGDIEKPIAIHVLNRPMICLIDVFWWLLNITLWLLNLSWRQVADSLHFFSRSNRNEDAASIGRSNLAPATHRPRSMHKTAAEMLVLSESGRNNKCSIHRAETRTLYQQVRSWISGRIDFSGNDADEQNNV